MNSRSFGRGRRVLLAWAELAVMGAEEAVDINFRKELTAHPSMRDELKPATAVKQWLRTSLQSDSRSMTSSSQRKRGRLWSTPCGHS